ncbi:unnamed protein product [Paramecium primaurelia]|uniref:Uncharacterized protein n=1 Tax=Paramecium primaurelia TaxID=5886 RepID=A0A8S1M4D8_PARPR|nr:unnamed protein product [Paramecium primaurelia]
MPILWTYQCIRIQLDGLKCFDYIEKMFKTVQKFMLYLEYRIANELEVQKIFVQD